ncbi:MAG: DUF2007 domain-containing protein [FCB group bacterium]|jgi:hypothetical protein
MDSLNNADIVEVKTFMDEITAELAKQLLEAEGVEAFVFKDDPGMMGLTRSASLMVERYNFEKATKILEAMDFE